MSEEKILTVKPTHNKWKHALCLFHLFQRLRGYKSFGEFPIKLSSGDRFFTCVKCGWLAIYRKTYSGGER